MTGAEITNVELNPVRAGIAETPESSDYTSIEERICGLPENKAPAIQAQERGLPTEPDREAATLGSEPLQGEDKVEPLPQAALMPYDATAQTPWAVPFSFEDYLELVDWTGRAILSDKRGHIPAGHPKILDRLGIDPQRFIGYSERLLEAFGTAIGTPASMVNLCTRRQTKYLHGIRAARQMFIYKRAA
jgi:hypothetical protein